MKNVAVVTGGSAAERGVSLKSADVVCRYLDKNKYRAFKVVINEMEWIVEENDNAIATIDKNDFSCVVHGEPIKFDHAFVALHGTPAEDGKLQGYLDLLQIPYNCCGVLQAALTFDKQRCKEYLNTFGVKTAPSKIFKKTTSISHYTVDFNYPVFVKPNKNGSSYGASKVEEYAMLKDAIFNAFQYDDEVIVEEFIKGTEVTCGVIKINGQITPLPLTEIRSKNTFFDFEAKYKGASQEITPAEISTELTSAIQQTSAMIYDKLDFKGMCRIDYIIRDNQYYMLEVNSIPGLSEESIIPQQAKALGISLTELFNISIG